MSNRSYNIIGVGALGGYYGGLLARSGLDVRFVARSDLAQLRKGGLRVDSVDGDFSLPSVKAYANDDPPPRCDVAVVCIKTTENHMLPSLLGQALAPDGVALVLQNGYGVEKQAGDVVGHDHVLGGLCFLCSNKIGPAHVHHLDYGQIKMGEHTAGGEPGGITQRLREIAADFIQAGIRVETTDDLHLARWQKLVWNIPFNGLSVTTGWQTDRIMEDPAALARVTKLMQEVAAAAHAVTGRTIEQAFIEKMLANTAKMKPYKPSMMIDHELGRPLEIDAMYAAPIRAAEQVGCEIPAMQELHAQLLAAAAQ